MRFAFISVIGEHHPRRLSNFATTVFVIKASFPCVETPCSATVSSAWLVACIAFVEVGITLHFFLTYPLPLHRLGIMLAFPLTYPPSLHCLGIMLAFSLTYPLSLHCLGITLAFSLTYPLQLSCKKRSRAYARLLKIQINSMNESKLLCYSSHCLIVILCSYPDIVLIWVLLLLK